MCSHYLLNTHLHHNVHTTLVTWDLQINTAFVYSLLTDPDAALWGRVPCRVSFVPGRRSQYLDEDHDGPAIPGRWHVVSMSCLVATC